MLSPAHVPISLGEVPLWATCHSCFAPLVCGSSALRSHPSRGAFPPHTLLHSPLFGYLHAVLPVLSQSCILYPWRYQQLSYAGSSLQATKTYTQDAVWLPYSYGSTHIQSTFSYSHVKDLRQMRITFQCTLQRPITLPQPSPSNFHSNHSSSSPTDKRIEKHERKRPQKRGIP
jgi:hypothetical protein